MASGTMGSNHWKRKQHCLTKTGRQTSVYGRFINDTAGDAVVEATILFPIMIMIFAALVLLAIYLPAKSTLQRSAQYAATALATEISDTWLFFDEGSMSYYWETDKNRLTNVYAGLFASSGDIQGKGEVIAIDIESRSISSRAGELSVECNEVNNILYREVVATVSRDFPMPVDLSFVGFPESITVTATSTVVVQNADEFIRNVDLAVTFAEFVSDKFELHNISDAISSFGSRVTGLLGW